jgi:arsenate reductase-like glutaredoxin family protein
VERTEFELDVTEAPPTSDQLKNIMEYLGGAPGKVIEGASDESDAQRRLKADGNAFKRPLVRHRSLFDEPILTVAGGGLEPRQGRYVGFILILVAGFH